MWVRSHQPSRRSVPDGHERTNCHGALTRGYDVTLVSDAHTAEDLSEWGHPLTPQQSIAFMNTAWAFTSAPGRTTAVVPAADAAV